MELIYILIGALLGISTTCLAMANLRTIALLHTHLLDEASMDYILGVITIWIICSLIKNILILARVSDQSLQFN